MSVGVADEHVTGPIEDVGLPVASQSWQARQSV